MTTIPQVTQIHHPHPQAPLPCHSPAYLFCLALRHLRIPALYPEILREAQRHRLLWRMTHAHPEHTCRGKVLWYIQAEDDATFTLWHRNRTGPKGYHPHCAPMSMTWGKLIFLASNIRGHDRVLYATPHRLVAA